MSKSSPIDEERLAKERDLEVKGTSRNAQETATTKFRQQVASKSSDLDDDEQERDLGSGGYSPKAMVGTWILMLAISIVLLMVPFFVSQFSIPIALGLILLMWLFGGLRYGCRRWSVHDQLTTQRFIDQTGILTHQTDRIEVIG